MSLSNAKRVLFKPDTLQEAFLGFTAWITLSGFLIAQAHPTITHAPTFFVTVVGVVFAFFAGVILERGMLLHQQRRSEEDA